MTNKKHYVIFVPGLGDGVKKIQLVTYCWRWFSLIPIVHAMDWRDGEKFQPKLKRLLDLIDEYFENGNIVSLVGTSAGGSAVVNAYMKRKNKIHRVINVCGRLTTGTHKGFRSFESKTKTSPAFAQSIQLCEKRENYLTKIDRRKIITVRPLFDEVVPPDTTMVKGAQDRIIPSIGHVLSITLSLTFFSKPLITFLTNESK